MSNDFAGATFLVCKHSSLGWLPGGTARLLCVSSSLQYAFLRKLELFLVCFVTFCSAICCLAGRSKA